MLHVAVVEDERAASEQLAAYLTRYAQEKGAEIRTSFFQDGEGILEHYRPVYDIILMDIDLPGVNGMEAAERIRARDSAVALLFITNIGQYAIQGYAVGALDYILKPVSFATFSAKLDRACNLVRQRASGQILLNLPDGAIRLDTRQIYYVDVQDRFLHYHTEEGEFRVRGTLQSVEKQLGPYHFVRCNYWYLVNLFHVTQVRRDTVVVAGHELEISRRSRTAFMTALADYVGGGA